MELMVVGGAGENDCELPRTVPITWKAFSSRLPFLLLGVVLLFQR